jgi:hypothetical protein
MHYTCGMNQPQKNQKPFSCCTKREMILAFAIPFLLVCSVWTIIDYIDVSDGLEKERDAGVTTKVPESEVWIILCTAQPRAWQIETKQA